MASFLLHLLSTYRYIIIVPISLVESNLTALTIGFFGRLGHINYVWGGFLVATADWIGDIVLYWLGFYKGEKFITRFGKYLGITDRAVENIKDLYSRHHSKILLGSKLVNGLGFAPAVLFTAGMTKIPFYKYMSINIVGECVWTTFLICLGFFFGHLYTTINNIIFRVGLVSIALIVILVVIRLQIILRKQW